MKNSSGNMLQDDENRSLFETGAETRRTVTDIPEIDLDIEWHKFNDRIKSRRWYMRPLTWRNAAAVAAFLAVAAVTAGVGVGIHRSLLSGHDGSDDVEEAVTDLVTSTAVTVSSDSMAAEPVGVIYTESKVYDNVPVKDILDDIASRSGAETECDENIAEMRLYLSVKAGSTLKDVAELIGSFDQINAEIIENESGKLKLCIK